MIVLHGNNQSMHVQGISDMNPANPNEASVLPLSRLPDNRSYANERCNLSAASISSS